MSEDAIVSEDLIVSEDSRMGKEQMSVEKLSFGYNR